MISLMISTLCSIVDECSVLWVCKNVCMFRMMKYVQKDIRWVHTKYIYRQANIPFTELYTCTCTCRWAHFPRQQVHV